MTVTIEEMAARWRATQSDREARAGARVQALRERLAAGKRLLAERYGARRVVLFGSLARGEGTERSDVDLAVEGLDRAGYFSAIAELMGLFEAPVDLVEIERASPSMLARLDLEGVEL